MALRKGEGSVTKRSVTKRLVTKRTLLRRLIRKLTTRRKKQSSVDSRMSTMKLREELAWDAFLNQYARENNDTKGGAA